MTKQELIQRIQSGEKIYCLLSTGEIDYLNANLGSIFSGAFVDGYLKKEESPFDFAVFYTDPKMINSWHKRYYYRSAIPVDSNRRSLATQ